MSQEHIRFLCNTFQWLSAFEVYSLSSNSYFCDTVWIWTDQTFLTNLVTDRCYYRNVVQQWEKKSQCYFGKQTHNKTNF